MIKIRIFSIGLWLLFLLTPIRGGEAQVGRREEVSIGPCVCEFRLFGDWRRLDAKSTKMELTDMKPSERVRGEIVPRGRHLIQLGCDLLRTPYLDWIRATERELNVPSHATTREVLIGVGAGQLSATEVDFVWEKNELHSTYWLFMKHERTFSVHLFGWSDDPGRLAARQAALKLIEGLGSLDRSRQRE